MLIQKHYVFATVVFPDKCSLHLVAINDDQLWKNHIGYWDDVYGSLLGE